jgi:hypothetical protein
LGGTGDRLRIAVTFEAETGMPVVGLLSGEMVLEGRPRYDPETRTLTMRNVDYTLSSDSVLAGIADWLLHDRLRERIQEELVFPMADLIEGIRQDLQSELESVSFGDYGNAEARVDSLAPSLLNVSDEALELAVVADGTLRLSLNLLATFNRLR